MKSEVRLRTTFGRPFFQFSLLSLSLVKNRAILQSWQLRAYANLRLGEEDEDGGGGKGTVTGFSETWTTAAVGWLVGRHPGYPPPLPLILGGNSIAIVWGLFQFLRPFFKWLSLSSPR